MLDLSHQASNSYFVSLSNAQYFRSSTTATQTNRGASSANRQLLWARVHRNQFRSVETFTEKSTRPDRANANRVGRTLSNLRNAWRDVSLDGENRSFVR